jgi:hypothetical protein
VSAPAGQSLADWLALSPACPTPDPSALTSAEWDELLAQAYRQGVAPQLYRRLAAEARARAVPRGALQAIWLGMARQRDDAARRQAELPIVLRCLRDAGVTPLLLKGAHFANAVYAEPLLRPMDDFDILVRLAELERAERVLRGAGYESSRTEPISDVCAVEHSLPTLLQRGTCPIELHWTIVPPGAGIPIDVDGLWARAQPIAVAGEPAFVLCPEDALLHICMHAAVLHLFDQGLRPLLDMAALLDRHGATLDWAALESRAGSWGVERAVYLLLELTRREAGAAVPGGVLDRLQPSGVPAAVIDAARAQLFEMPFLGDVHTRSLAQAWAQPLSVWKAVFSTRTALARQSGPSRSPLASGRYYVLRLNDLLRRYGGAAWQLARRDRRRIGATSGRIQREMVLRGWLERARS